eukprot:5922288-Amphidinium_carterae.1
MAQEPGDTKVCPGPVDSRRAQRARVSRGWHPQHGKGRVRIVELEVEGVEVDPQVEFESDREVAR